jgi:hypothetical protein
MQKKENGQTRLVHHPHGQSHPLAAVPRGRWVWLRRSTGEVNPMREVGGQGIKRYWNEISSCHEVRARKAWGSVFSSIASQRA